MKRTGILMVGFLLPLAIGCGSGQLGHEQVPSSNLVRLSDAELCALIEQLGSKDPADVQIEAKIALAGSRAVPLLIARLESGDSWVRSRAAAGLALIGDNSAVPALTVMAKNKDERYESALDALGTVGGPDAADALLAALPNEVPEVQAAIISHLAAIGDNRAVGPLCEMLRGSSSVKARCRAAEALGCFRDPRSRAALRCAIEADPDWDVYMTAKRSFFNQSAGGGFVLSSSNPLYSYVEIVVMKQPEPPEGAEEFVRRYKETHPVSPLGMGYDGPTVHSFVTPAQYSDAREQLVEFARHPDNAQGLVEALLNYMRYRHIEEGPGQKASRLIVDIGKLAVPALQNAVKRGDDILKANALRCVEEINQVDAAEVKVGERGR